MQIISNSWLRWYQPWPQKRNPFQCVAFKTRKPKNSICQEKCNKYYFIRYWLFCTKVIKYSNANGAYWSTRMSYLKHCKNSKKSFVCQSFDQVIIFFWNLFTALILRSQIIWTTLATQRFSLWTLSDEVSDSITFF